MTARRYRIGIVALAIVAIAPVVASAQSGAASITGLVVDETGAALPGVTVTATNQATNVERGVTNEAGNYTITPVTVGTYVIKAELAGFRTPPPRRRPRGEAGRAARLQDGRRRDCRDHPGHRLLADPSDGDDDRRGGPLGQHRAVAAAQRPQHRPAHTALARDGHLQPAGLHQHRQRQHEPAVRQRQP